LIVHVVLPTPPFWFATAMTVPTRFLPSFPSPERRARAEAVHVTPLAAPDLA
jgi:hypothetical protein